MAVDPPEHSQPTRDLLAGHLAGDTRAGNTLFGRHRQFLLDRARADARMGILRRHMTEEDVVDEVFVRVLGSRYLHRFEDMGAGSLRRLLATILDRTFSDACRRLGTRKRTAPTGIVPLTGLALDEVSTSAEGVGGHTPTTPSGRARLAETFALCRERLGPIEWRILQMKQLHGLNATDIGRQLGLTPAAVRGILHRMRRKLAGLLEPPGPDD